MFELANKELSERAARKSTYNTRMLNLGVLLLVFVSLHAMRLGRAPGANFGGGDTLFFILAWAQWLILLLVIPGTVGGAIASERERGTWTLLQLTDLRPWEILSQKYIAGIIPMLTGTLLLAPLGAMTFSVGGLETHQIWLTILTLTVTTLLVGAVSLFASTLTRTGFAATILSYLFIGGLIFTPYASPLTPLKRLQDDQSLSWTSLLVSLALSALFLILAYLALKRDPDQAPRRSVATFFAAIDRKFAAWGLSNRTATGLDSPLLRRAPVAWREVKRQALSQNRHLFWYALPFLAIILGVCWGVDHLPSWQASQVFPILNGCLWLGSALVLALHSANIVVRERTEQTLPILLTTPIESGQMMLQKARSLHRMAIICAMVISTGAIASLVMRNDLNPLVYVLTVALCLFAYLPGIYWLGLTIGARCQTRGRAVLAVFLTLGTILGLPLLTLPLLNTSMLPAFFPAVIILANETLFTQLPPLAVIGLICVHFVVALVYLLMIRHLAIWFAGQWLGRVSGPPMVNPEHAMPENGGDPY